MPSNSPQQVPRRSPIGIGNTARRIIAKAILTVTKGDVQEVSGAVQLCAGQICGTETAVHTVTSLFQQEETEAMLLVDASNAFNRLNRLVALHNIHHLCPSLATTPTDHQHNCLLMAVFSTPVKVQHKGTPWPCQCTR